MAELEKELEQSLQHHEGQLRYVIKNRKVQFENDVRAVHRRVKFGIARRLRESQLRNVLSAPFVYSMIFPIAFLDFSITIYQAICFRLYRI